MRLVVTLIDDEFERAHVSPYFLPGSASLADLQAAAAVIVARLHAEYERAGIVAPAESGHADRGAA